MLVGAAIAKNVGELLLREEKPRKSDDAGELRIKFPSPARPGMETRNLRLEGGDVRCLQALWTLGHIEFNRLPLGERPVPISLNCGEVHKHVLTGLALNESESLAGIEPLHCSLFFHLFFLF